VVGHHRIKMPLDQDKTESPLGHPQLWWTVCFSPMLYWRNPPATVMVRSAELRRVRTGRMHAQMRQVLPSAQPAAAAASVSRSWQGGFNSSTATPAGKVSVIKAPHRQAEAGGDCALSSCVIVPVTASNREGSRAKRWFSALNSADERNNLSISRRANSLQPIWRERASKDLRISWAGFVEV
jgi:hypothetical protein